MATIKVRAKIGGHRSFGFYGTKRRYNGDEFDFNYDDSKPVAMQLGSWMELVEPLPEKKVAKEPKKVIKETVDVNQ